MRTGISMWPRENERYVHGVCIELGVVEQDAVLLTGIAAGRRVSLPWGGGSFDVATLTPDGLTLMQEALEPAAGP